MIRGFLLLEGDSVKGRLVGNGEAYVFVDEKGAPAILRVNSIEKLLIVVNHGLVPEEVLKLHLEKGYLVKWTSE